MFREHSPKYGEHSPKYGEHSPKFGDDCLKFLQQLVKCNKHPEYHALTENSDEENPNN
jgi:hypothetical protein